MNTENQLIDDEATHPSASKEKQEHVNASDIYSKGVLSIIFSILTVLYGLVFTKQCLDMARDAEKEIAENPGLYLDESIKKIKNGKTLAYIGFGIFLSEVVALVAYMSIAS